MKPILTVVLVVFYVPSIMFVVKYISIDVTILNSPIGPITNWREVSWTAKYRFQPRVHGSSPFLLMIPFSTVYIVFKSFSPSFSGFFFLKIQFKKHFSRFLCVHVDRSWLVEEGKKIGIIKTVWYQMLCSFFLCLGLSHLVFDKYILWASFMCVYNLIRAKK